MLMDYVEQLVRNASQIPAFCLELIDAFTTKYIM